MFMGLFELAHGEMGNAASPQGASPLLFNSFNLELNNSPVIEPQSFLVQFQLLNTETSRSINQLGKALQCFLHCSSGTEHLGYLSSRL